MRFVLRPALMQAKCYYAAKYMPKSASYAGASLPTIERAQEGLIHLLSQYGGPIS